jgi:hypothetical protein
MQSIKFHYPIPFAGIGQNVIGSKLLANEVSFLHTEQFYENAAG